MDTSRRFRIVALFSTAAVVIAIAIAAYGGGPRIDAATTRPGTAVAPMSDRWYVETRNRPTQRDSWYIEARTQTSARDRWYLEAKAQPSARDRWYLEAKAQPSARDRWYLEAKAQPAARDRWYLEAKAQPAARDRWYLDMPGAREHSILTSHGQADHS